MRADSNSRPPRHSPEIHAHIDELVNRAPSRWETLVPKPIVLDRHLLELGLKAGPDFKPFIDAVFEAQLDGAFADEAETVGVKPFLQRH